MAAFSKLGDGVTNVYIMTWDIALFCLNLVSPNRKVGSVVPEGNPGFGGKWPEFHPPTDSDSRCSCPALNAMANHGILPRDGKNIPFTEMTEKIRTTYNFAPTFCLFVPRFAANYLKKDYHKDTFNLQDLDLHNEGIEHDASLTREDAAISADQSKPSLPLIEALLATASGRTKEGEVLLTAEDLSQFSAKRRVDARKTNPDYQLDFGHKMFSSSNSSTMLTIFGGRVNDLTTILKEERLPNGWESRVLNPWGLTMAAFNKTVFRVEHGINEEKIEKEEAAAAAAGPSAGL